MNAMNGKSHQNPNAMCAFIYVCILCTLNQHSLLLLPLLLLLFSCWLFEPTSVYRLQIDVLIVKDESPHYVARNGIGLRPECDAYTQTERDTK